MKTQEQLRQNSQRLRRNMTKEERHLWYDFLKGYPIPIHRQYIIETYIVDFYCHQAKLVIELDGNQHCIQEAMTYDQMRTAVLTSHGLYVLRISNLDIMKNFRGVCEMIHQAIQDRMCLF